MTTEIAVMNKSAISLAADSAVTIGRGHKFYNTANKLFTLSKYHPVGIMVYNNADFMGIPIETIIKEYRKNLGDTCFDSLEEYWDDFVRYLEENFSDNEKLEDFIVKIVYLIHALDEHINIINEEKIDEYLKKSSKNNETLEQIKKRFKEIASESITIVISDFYDTLNSCEDDSNFYDKKEIIKDTIKEKVYEITKEIIGNIDKDNMKKILDISTMVLTKKHIEGPRTGIVIAGFGEKDMFPKLINAEFMGVYFNTLKHDNKTITKIDNKNEATIIPFGQDDVISTFMTGIDQALKLDILKTIEKYETEYCDNEKCIDMLRKDVHKRIEFLSRRFHINPIMKTVSIAPKEELAKMAETLVNLTSFRRNLSMDEYSQSVGGPIDVALITKGDGFIWMKRKHYFDLNNNQHFVQNYFRDNRRDNRYDHANGE